MEMIKIGQQKQEKQNTFNENSKNKASDPEKITDVNWLKYKLILHWILQALHFLLIPV